MISPIITDALLASLAIVLILIGLSVLRGFVMLLSRRGSAVPEPEPQQPQAARKPKQAK